MKVCSLKCPEHVLNGIYPNEEIYFESKTFKSQITEESDVLTKSHKNQ